ncbi:MAG: DUF4450 domain-containing protein [Duncaniella sp.]|nr:DUF4450 domain-containing protein [Duncaniella sp.]
MAAAGLSVASQTKQLHYRPTADGTGAFCVDGTTKFNRGLYGAHTGFRIDCSDMPEFGVYLPRMGGNLLLTLPDGECLTTYTPGRMDYLKGGVKVEAQVGRTEDAALWKVTNTNPRAVTVGVRFGGVADKKFSREGDLGVDKPDCFDLKPEYCKGNIYKVGKKGLVTIEYGNKKRQEINLVLPTDTHSVTDAPCYEGEMKLKPGESRIIALFPAGIAPETSQKKLQKLLDKAEADRVSLTKAFAISTPDPWLSPVGSALSVAADGIWSGEAWLHGSIGWRTPHLGWRGAYTGDAIGLHDRALTHYRTYAANQVTDIPPTLSHPQQDSALNLARADKKWGTPMYSNGYICRRPGHQTEMSHYDMNMVYADALLRHFRHTADTASMRELFPVVKLHLDWEKRNFDPDGDHLYDAYCCIWASDALYYSGGAVTHSSAYNMLANSIAADVAEAIGEDPTPYRREAEAIGRALDSVLWMDDRGHWAEYRDLGHNERLHPAAALWTIYHAIDSEVADPFKNYAATAYVDREIPHIPVTAEGEKTLYTLSTTNWKPYSWSINNVAIAEVMHTALAYWLAQRPDEAFKLMKGTVMDNMYTGASPLNFGQISQYDAARGECYRDFADPIGVWSRALTEGLYGIRPVRIGADPRVDVIPGFPKEWNEASITLPDISYSFARKGDTDTYEVDNRYPAGTAVRFTVPASGLRGVTVDGRQAPEIAVALSIGEPRISVTLDTPGRHVITIDRNADVKAKATGNVRKEGPVTFTEMAAGPLLWWEPSTEALPSIFPALPADFKDVRKENLAAVRIDTLYNSSLPQLFRNKYLSPRPNVTTLQLPVQGIGEWCHPKATFEIDDSGFRKILAEAGDTLRTPDEVGVSFVVPSNGDNVAFTSLWDNYPDSLTFPLSGEASHIYLLMAGTTSHMQWGMENARLTARYTDGTTSELPIINPLNWAPVEQDFFTDGYAYAQPGGAPAPLRVSFDDGLVSRNILDTRAGKPMPIDPGMELGLVRGRELKNGAGVLVDFPVDPAKTLESLTLTTLSHDVVTGIMAITLQRP